MTLDRIGVEIGGTFTDLVWRREDGALTTHKVMSTPEEIHRAVMQVIEAVEVDLEAVGHVIHGSTVATNALLTRLGARTGLLTTKGFRDVIEIGSHDRQGNVYEILYRKPRPPVARQFIREVPERIQADGAVVEAIDLDAAWSEAQKLIDGGVEAIAICFLHAHRNAAHEAALAALIRERAPHVLVTASHEISPEFREYERTMTTVVIAFVGPVVKGYMDKLAAGLSEQGFTGALQILQSNGGIMPASNAGEQGARILLSGPAAGVRGALWFAKRNGIKNAVTIDMGGTSTDVCLAPELEPAARQEFRIDGLPVRSPSIDITTVGAGGGSIAALDPGGFLAVGPASAGAKPGPACYGQGGEAPTVTDAQLVSGILRPERFLGGRMTLYPELAESAFSEIDLDETTVQAADNVLRVVNNNMAAALRLVSTERGIDPRDYVLVGYGGGGPIHAAMVAEEVGISRVLVPWSPGLVSAFGLLVADPTIDLVRTHIHAVDENSLNAAIIEELKTEGLAAATRHGIDPQACDVAIGLDLRYAGQAYELTVWFGDSSADADSLRAAFAEAHNERYGYAREQLPVEAVNYRTRIVQRRDGTLPPLFTPTPDADAEAVLMEGAVTLGGQSVSALFADRATLPAGFTQDGPLVVEEPTATTLTPPGWRLTVLASGDLMLERIEP